MRGMIFSLAASAVLVSGCSGGGGSSSTLPPTSVAPHTVPTSSPVTSQGKKGTVVLHFAIPRSTHTSTMAKKLRPAYVSPSSATLAVIDDGDPSSANYGGPGSGTTSTYALTSSTNCVAGTGTQVCTIPVTLAAGRHELVLSVYDANGNLLSSNQYINDASGASVSLPIATVVAGQSGSMTATLSGVPNSYTLQQAHLLHGGVPASNVAMNWEAQDADGNNIIAPHPDTFVFQGEAFPGESFSQNESFGSLYSLAFTGITGTEPNSAACTACVILENPGTLSLSYNGTDPYGSAAFPSYHQLNSYSVGGGQFSPVIDYGTSFTPNALHFATDVSAAQSVTLSNPSNVQSVEVIETAAEGGGSCGNASASLTGSTITVQPAAGMPVRCVLAINRTVQGPTASSLPIYQALPITVGGATGSSDGSESTGDISFASPVSAPQSYTITPGIGFSGTITPGAYQCYSPSLTENVSGTGSAASNVVPLSQIASITPASGTSTNGSPVTFTISPIAPGVCALSTTGVSGNDPLSVVISVGF